MTTIILTSDIKIYREGLGNIVTNCPDFVLLGSAEDYDSAVALITATPPEILLLDMTMSGSCQLAAQVFRISPQTKIVAVAVIYDENNIVQYAEAGITCYVPREASVNELVKAICVASKGECYCPPKVAACLLKKVRNITQSADSVNTSSSDSSDLVVPSKSDTQDVPQTLLTRREHQIAGLLVRGMSNKQIANKLLIEVSTVKNHVHNLLVKLKVHNRSQAVFLLNKLSIPGVTNPARPLSNPDPSA